MTASRTRRRPSARPSRLGRPAYGSRRRYGKRARCAGGQVHLRHGAFPTPPWTAKNAAHTLHRQDRCTLRTRRHGGGTGRISGAGREPTGRDRTLNVAALRRAFHFAGIRVPHPRNACSTSPKYAADAGRAPRWDRGGRRRAGYVTRRTSWSAVSASTPNMQWHITFEAPRTRTWRPPNSSLSRPLTRSPAVRSLYRTCSGSWKADTLQAPGFGSQLFRQRLVAAGVDVNQRDVAE